MTTTLAILAAVTSAAVSSAIGYAIGYSTAILADPKGTPPNE